MRINFRSMSWARIGQGSIWKTRKIGEKHNVILSERINSMDENETHIAFSRLTTSHKLVH